MKGRVTIAELKHHVQLCTMHDVVSNKDGTMELSRSAVAGAWAKVEAKKASMFSTANVAIKDQPDQQTHLITIRSRTDLDVSSAAWLFEHRLMSGDRWFKVLGTHELDNANQFTVFSCKLMERGTVMSLPQVQAPQPMAPRPQPAGVKL